MKHTFIALLTAVAAMTLQAANWDTFPAAGALDGSETIPLNQSGTTKHGTIAQIRNGLVHTGSTYADPSFVASLNFSKLTNLPDPVITATGNVTGSVTLPDLGSGTMSLTLSTTQSAGHVWSGSNNFTGTFRINSVALGTAAFVDTGTGSSQVPTNSALGNAAYRTVGTGSNNVAQGNASGTLVIAGAATGTGSVALGSSGTMTLVISPTIAPKVVTNVFEGDSLFVENAGTGIPPMLALYAPEQFGVGTTGTNVATSGETIVQMNSQYATQVHPFASTSGKLVRAILMAPTNDIYSMRTPAQIYADLKTWWAAARADGMKVYACTMPANDFKDHDNRIEFLQKHALVNALIQSDPSLVDGIFPFHQWFPDPFDATYFDADRLHLNTAGRDLAARKIAAYFNDPISASPRPLQGYTYTATTGTVSLGNTSSRIQFIDPSGTTVPAKLPLTSACVGKEFLIKNVGAGGTINIITSGSSLIDALPPGWSARATATASGWETESRAKNAPVTVSAWGINAKVVGNTTFPELSILPVGTRFLVQSLAVETVTSSTFTTPPTLSLGHSGSTDTIVASGTFTGTSIGGYQVFTPKTDALVLTGSQALTLRITGTAAAASMTLNAHVTGIFLP